MLYFAYGSNMSHARMQERCPGGRFLKTVRLERHRFVYDGYSVASQGAVSNIVTSERDVVRGALYEITGKDKLALDVFEGYPRSYDRKIVEVKDEDGDVYLAWTYFRTGRALGKPHPDYEKTVLQGAKDCKLPDEYIDRFLRVIRI